MSTTRALVGISDRQLAEGPEGEAASPSGRAIARNALWNLAGYATPTLAAVGVIPVLIRLLGPAQYGILTIGWGLIAYLGLCDIGLDSALTKLVAERLGRVAEIRELYHTGFIILLITGACGGVFLAAMAHTLAYHWFAVPKPLRHETAIVFCIFAAALPFVITTSCFRGTLAAYQRFDLINRIQIATGLLTFLGPLVVLTWSHSLVAISGAIAFAKLFAWAAFFWTCAQVEPALGYIPVPRLKTVRPLLTYGGWMSLSAITDPIFLYSDRFILGIVLSVSAVAYYATPFDMVVRLWLIPDALNAALFPNYASTLANARHAAMSLLERVGNFIIPAILAPVMVVLLFSHEILSLWISESFAAHSAMVLSILALGVLLSSIARIPWTLLVACRPDLPAKLALVEAPGYLTILYILSRALGLEGAAMAWVLRMAFNCSVLHILTWRLLSGARTAVRKNALMTIVCLVTSTGGLLLVSTSIAVRATYLTIGLLAAWLLMWFYLISSEQRAEMTSVCASYFPTLNAATTSKR
jgi:O-antigen/teichoic acid export membrane protein